MEVFQILAVESAETVNKWLDAGLNLIWEISDLWPSSISSALDEEMDSE